MIKNTNHNQGFSLIEMIVALGIFSIVVTTAVGSLIVVINNNQKLQAEQSAMTNLAFALDSMTREIRMGYNYYCDSQSSLTSGGPNNIFNKDNNPESILGDGVNDCPDSHPNGHTVHGVSFYEGGDSLTGVTSKRITYYYDATNKKIMRRVGNDDAESVMSSGIDITSARFYVTGSDTLESANNTEQPTVTIQIEARSSKNVTGKIYYLQTTVAQRTLDI